MCGKSVPGPEVNEGWEHSCFKMFFPLSLLPHVHYWQVSSRNFKNLWKKFIFDGLFVKKEKDTTKRIPVPYQT
jgi:hypothetical protein